MREPDYRGIAAVAIGICGALGVFVLVPLGTLFGLQVGRSGGEVLIALGGALVGAFATYMGMKIEQKLKNGSEEPPK